MKRLASYCFCFSILVTGTACGGNLLSTLATSPTDTAASTVTPSGSATSPTAAAPAPDLEGFTCDNLQDVRVRFNDPGFVRRNEVALYAAFLGAPPGDKFLRIYWDYANKPDKMQVVDTQEGEVQRDNDELFDVEEIVEHTYDGLSGQTERTVRVELIHEVGNTRLCARNRNITVRPPAAPESEDPPQVLFSFNGSLFGPSELAVGPEKTLCVCGNTGSSPTSWTEDGVKRQSKPSAGGLWVVCPSSLGLALIAKSSKHENAKQPHWAQARSSCWGTRSPPL